MAQLETTFTLPSRGLPYPDNPEFSEPFTIRMLTGKDEKKLYGSNLPNPVKTILEASIVSPKVDVELLTPNDTAFILMKSRIWSYGPDYNIDFTCPHCGYHNSRYPISLDDVNIQELDAFTNTVQVNLPVTKHTLVIQSISPKDYKKINDRVKKLSKQQQVDKGEQEFLTFTAWSILEINSETKMQVEKEKFVSDLPVRDINAIEKAQRQLNPHYGYDDTITISCPKCQEDVDAPIQLTSEFFRPDIA